MEIDIKNIITKDYIILDWNVIQYIKNNTNYYDDYMQIINCVRRRYEFPFCEAHLKDLANSFSEDNKEQIDQDLSFLKQISKSVAVVVEEKTEKLYLIKLDPCTSFQEILFENSKEHTFSVPIYPITEFQVDMQQLDKEHPMYNILEKSNGIYSPIVMAEWIEDTFFKLNNSVNNYKEFRFYINKIKRDLERHNTDENFLPSDLDYKKKLIHFAMPFLDAMEIDNEEKLATIWRDAVMSWLKITNSIEVSFKKQIITAYNMLDFHPLFYDKLKKNKNTLSNITRDSQMVYYASSGKFFVTEDKKCLKKAQLILKAFNCRCKVMNMEQFYRKFS